MLTENSNKCLSKHPKFIYDEACLDIINTLNESINVFGQYNECHKCNFQNLATLGPAQNTSILLNSNYPIQLYYVKNGASWCNYQKLLSEHFRYGWNITETCNTIYIKEPADNPYLPILTAFIILFCFGTIWYMVKCIYKYSGRVRRIINWNTDVEDDLGSGSTPLVILRSPAIKKHPTRIKSVDIFRGLCIILMIFVNYGGGQYWFFRHSIWNGLTVADLVFPWFMWLMGLSLTVSLHRKLRAAVPRRLLVFQVLRRSLILILLGVVINSNHNLKTIANLRYPGVLQRLGVTYLIVGLFEVLLTKRIETDNISCIYDITSAWAQYLLVFILITIHTCVTFLVDVPGCGKGYLGPGGLEDGGQHYNCTGGVAGYIDREVFGEHMYKHPTVVKMYETNVFYDPEGILGILTSVVVVHLGVQAGRTLNTYQSVRSKIIRWLLWGLVLGLIGGGLCGFTKNDGVIPINKNLWSLSYVLVSSAMAFVILSFLFIVVDILRKWGGRPFFYPGMNSLFLFIGHELFKKTFPFAWTPTSETHSTYLFMNLWGTALWVAMAIFMYKRNIFFSI